MATDPYREFRQAADRPEEQIDLGRAALTISLPEYPTLDFSAFLGRISDLALEVTERAGVDADVFRSIAALNFVLFARHGFSGNRDDYYDPKNSFLNQVIERKTGIPITLSVLYMEVAERVGLTVNGVGFPGHFMVTVRADGNEIVIDPFNSGDIKTEEDLAVMLQQMYGGKLGFRREFLAPVSKKQILTRMLTNLKAIYVKANDMVKTLGTLDRLLILDPASAADTRDRGVIYTRLECFGQAKDDFERYLELAPDADDATAVREQLIELAKQVVLIH
ncbi:MAG: Tetratricopeptide repeat protein [Deltaproteobacteria bacterium]|nr:Tetratricopeptide repeat protein [Deltaproteobacteria bacterium]